MRGTYKAKGAENTDHLFLFDIGRRRKGQYRNILLFDTGQKAERDSRQREDFVVEFAQIM